MEQVDEVGVLGGQLVVDLAILREKGHDINAVDQKVPEPEPRGDHFLLGQARDRPGIPARC